MDEMNGVLLMWKDEAIVVVTALAGVVLFHYATKLFSAPVDALLGAILGFSIGLAAAGLYLTRHLWGIALSTRACWFIALYMWCVLVMLFFASKDTRGSKIFLGLASQAGILYALFVLL